MPYANEAEYRAAVVAYRALHDVFYRFQKSVRDQRPHAGAHVPLQRTTADLVAANERDYAAMVELLPSLARAYVGPRDFLERLAETLQRLGEKHAASRQAPFDAQITHQAYVDIDNIFQELLSMREHYPLVFEEAFCGDDAEKV
jgi:hypothetical protein